jgi:hypothetical protein
MFLLLSNRFPVLPNYLQNRHPIILIISKERHKECCIKIMQYSLSNHVSSEEGHIFLCADRALPFLILMQL